MALTEDIRILQHGDLLACAYPRSAIDARARMVMDDGKPAENIFAAGEIMAGNILGKGYVAGVGMTIGTVFGEIAGREAARVGSASRTGHRAS